MSRARLGPAAGLAVVAAAACVLIARQPVTSPWWVYSDADATYSASALEILAGNHSSYFDHPGLVEQELLAASFAVQSLPQGGPTHAYAFREMVQLGRARPVFRGWAIAFFVGGAVLAFFLVGRLLGHWTWGVAGGLLWLAQPELPDTIQIRPDVLQAGIALVVGFLCVRALERRSAVALVAAAAVLGFALMVKLASIALLVPLLVASVAGHPGAGWPRRLRAGLRALFDRHRAWVVSGTVAWLVLALVSNLRAPAVQPTNYELELLGGAVLGIAGYAALCLIVRRWGRGRRLLRVFDPLYCVLALALAAGVAVPVGLLVGDGMAAIASVVQTLGGGNLNARITPFQQPFSIFESYPLFVPSCVFVLAGVATLVGLKRRTLWPALWFGGAILAGTMAFARLGYARYFALPYVLSIPPTLWLFRAQARRGTALVAVAIGLLLLALLPTFQHSGDDAAYAAGLEARGAALTRLADRVMKPGQIAVVPDTAPVADVNWFQLVYEFTGPEAHYPYRFVSDNKYSLAPVHQQHLRLQYYIGPKALDVAKAQELQLDAGRYRVLPLPDGRDVADGIAAVRLVSGPGT